MPRLPLWVLLIVMVASTTLAAPLCAEQTARDERRDLDWFINQSNQAERLLLAGKPSEAERIYRFLATESTSFLRSAACKGIARCMAERGEFSEARKWLNEGFRNYWDICYVGVLIEKDVTQNLDAVWAVAASSDPDRLQALAEGKAPADREDEDARRRRKAQRWEASLLLGEAHADQGDIANARRYLRRAAKAKGWGAYHTIGDLARARLKRLEEQRTASTR